LSGLPPQVREGDRLRAGFTVRNASDRAVGGAPDAGVTADGGKAQALPRRNVTLAPGESREVGWDTTVPAGATKLQWECRRPAGAQRPHARHATGERRRAGAHAAGDAVQLDGTKTMPVERPADALPGRGGIRTTLQARLGGDLPGVRDYMARIPTRASSSALARRGAARPGAVGQGRRDPAGPPRRRWPASSISRRWTRAATC
jgi:hypothetical protein